MCVCVYIYIHIDGQIDTMEYYSAVRKNEMLPFITTHMDLGGYYGKRNKSKRQMLYGIAYMWTKNKTN